jgi:hypothetical protein
MLGDSGYWWKRWWWDEVPIASTVRLDGDPSAMSKKVPILWRYWQDWWCLEVEGLQDGTCKDGYYLFFTTSDDPDHGDVRRYHKKLHAPYIMVREGQGPVRFWIADEDSQPGLLRKTGLMVPANRWRRNASSGSVPSTSEILQGGQVWV